MEGYSFSKPISKVPDARMSEINSGCVEFTDIHLISIKVIFLLENLSTCFNLFFLMWLVIRRGKFRIVPICLNDELLKVKVFIFSLEIRI